MKSYELKPNYDNLLKTYLEDTIGRNNDIFRFVSMLNAIDANCSIVLDGNWGNGKTFFVKQIKMFLDANNDFITPNHEEDIMNIKNHSKKYFGKQEINFQPQVCVYYDAWENDNDDDPVLSLIYSILINATSDFSIQNDTGLIKKATSILEFFTGKNWSDLIENLKKDSPFEEMAKYKNIENQIKEFLDSLLLEKGNRLIVFVDELDRCKPSYAVRLLERIKHYFGNDRITFVFSVNINELQHTVKRHYGDEFNACRYLDRFFDLQISLPPADKSRFYQSIDFENSQYTFDIVCGAVIDTYNFSLREITKYIRLTKIAAFEPTHDSRKYDFSFSEGRTKQFCLLYIIPVMIGIKIYDSDKYNAFISGKNNVPLIEVSNCLKDHFFDELLNRTETYNEEDKDRTLTTIEAKLGEVYEALFVKEYSGNNYQTQIGQYSFNSSIKEMLFRTTSMLSDYANFEIE